MSTQSFIFKTVQSRFIHKSPKMSIIWQMDKQIVVYSYNKAIFSNNKAQILTHSKTMNECKIHYTKLKKPNTKKHLQYSIYMNRQNIYGVGCLWRR